MKVMHTALFIIATFFGMQTVQAATNLNQYENLMTNKVWITTEAVNADNQIIPSSDKSVNGFFGIAEYNANGTFKMFTQEGKLKLAGDWSISQDGKSRTLIAKKPDGSVMFTRTVENVTVEPNLYVYRIYPEANNKNVYFDIVHKPLSILLTDSK
ncbi:DUF4822 domain-containing protein [Utexia brackfieldae]|uniref:DUF4822 domain-containing protein n=1 Tax=Utexia brackfieldae TaxID=3074108 RepID=UPI00370D65B7